MDKKADLLARRDFFKKTGAVIGAAGVAGVAAATSVEAAEPTTKKQISVGYQETDHVRTYYKLAKF